MSGLTLSEGEFLQDSDLEEEAATEPLVGQLGTVWSDSSRIGGGRRLCTTKLRAPQSETAAFLGEAVERPEQSSPDLSPRCVLWRFVVDPSDDV